MNDLEKYEDFKDNKPKNRKKTSTENLEDFYKQLKDAHIKRNSNWNYS